MRPPDLLGDTEELATPLSVDVVDRYPSAQKRGNKLRVVWPPARKSKEIKSSLQKRNDPDGMLKGAPSKQLQSSRFVFESDERDIRRNFPQTTQPDPHGDLDSQAVLQESHVYNVQSSDSQPSPHDRPRRESKDAALDLTGGNQNSKALVLSQIRSQNPKLKPTSERPEPAKVVPLEDPKGWGGLIAAIQKGVLLRHVDPALSESAPQKTPTSALLEKLQERKKECMRNQGR